MKLKKPKHLFFRLFGVMLIAGAIVLGYYQYQWISTSASVEKQRILNEMHISSERALEKAFDEIRALISFSYITPADIIGKGWASIDEAIAYWKQQSSYPDLLEAIFLIPGTPEDPYMVFDEIEKAFVEIDIPSDFEEYERELSLGNAFDALQKAYPPLIPKGYFVLPFSFEAGDRDKAARVSAFLAIRADADMYFGEIVPGYLEEYIGDYQFRISRPREVLYSSSALADASREPDHVIPILNSFLLAGRERPPREIEKNMENPVSRYWFFRTQGLPGIDPGRISHTDTRLHSPLLEIFHPDRPLDSAMRWRITSNLLLSGGTLLVLIAAYFVLYVLLSRTDMLRNRERDFVTSMSHELRTPLSVINATSDNLARGIVDDPERTKRYGNLIQAQSQRLGKMVESILFYSGMESMDSARVEEVDLKAFFEELVQNLAPTAEEAGARIVLTIDTRIQNVKSHPDALRIIAENLIVNALRHGARNGEGGEVRVEIRTRPPRFLYLIIEDDGQGIPAGEMRGIFEPFARGERSKTDQVPGSGLGLHIVQRVSNQLGGQVGAESPYTDMAGASKDGARFTVKIPVGLER